MLLLCLVMFWTRGVPRLAGTASKRRRGSRSTEAWTRSYAWGPDFDICGLGSWKNGTSYWDREIGKQIAVANKLQTIVVSIFSTHWWQVCLHIGRRWKTNARDKKNKLQKRRSTTHYPQFLIVFGGSPCFVLIIQIRFGCRDSMNSNAPSNFEDLDTQNSLDECCIRGARFLFLIDAVVPSSHWCDAKGRTGAVERRAAPSKGTAGGHELVFFSEEHLGFCKWKQYEYSS